MLMQGTLLKHLAEIDETCHNKLLRELKKQYAKLVEAVKHTVVSVSKVFETLRKNMICYRYNI